MKNYHDFNMWTNEKKVLQNIIKLNEELCKLHKRQKKDEIEA